MPAPPRKLIWVSGEASGVPGSGETVTGLAAAAAADELLASSTAGLACEAPPQAPSAIAPAERGRAPRSASPGCSRAAAVARRAALARKRDRHRPAERPAPAATE